MLSISLFYLATLSLLHFGFALFSLLVDCLPSISGIVDAKVNTIMAEFLWRAHLAGIPGSIELISSDPFVSLLPLQVLLEKLPMALVLSV